MKKYVLLILLLISEIVVSAQNVKITGVVKNSTDSIISFYRNGFDVITNELGGKRYNSKVANNGDFEVVLPEKSINEWVIRQGDSFALLYLCNGHHLNLNIDLKQDRNSRIIAKGINANEVNVISYLNIKETGKYGSSFYETARALNTEEALKLRKQRAEFLITALEEYHNRHGLSDEYYKWLKTFYKYEAYERTLVESKNSIELRMDSGFVKMLTENGVNDEYAAKNTREYMQLVGVYTMYKFNGGVEGASTYDYLNFVANTNVLKGATKDVLLTNYMFAFSKMQDTVYNKYKKYIVSIKDKQLVNLIKESRRDYLEKIAQGKLSKENVSQSASLNEIFTKYKGKVVYVDFWASWCMPCRAEMPNAAELKKKLKNKDVVFLYFGYRDKKEDWLAARKELGIEGEHVLMSPKLIKEADALFEISGIPHYAIIDREGTILNKAAPRPNGVYDELLKLADKNN